MINDLIITTLVSGLEEEIGERSSYDEDRFKLIKDEEIRAIDPNLTLAVRDGDITPIDYEIGQLDASHYRYAFSLEVSISHSVKSEGYALNRKLIKRIRKALFVRGSGSLSSKLLALEDTESGIIERVSKFTLIRIQPNRATIDTGFVFLTVLSFNFETESIFT